MSAPLLRALAYDVDGTLAASFAPPPRALRELIADLDEAGVPQVIVSGKPDQYVAGFARALGLAVTGWVIGENGATLYNWHTLETALLAEHLADVRALRRWLWEERLDPADFYEEPNLAGISFFRNDLDFARAEELRAEIDARLAGEGYALRTEIHPDSAIVVLQEGVNKARALGWVAERLGLAPEQFAAFGEGINDVAMLEATYPLAPSDAHPAVQAVVRERGGYLAAQPGPEGVLEGFRHLAEAGLTEFAVPVPTRAGERA